MVGASLHVVDITNKKYALLYFIYLFIYSPRYSHALGSKKKKKLTERARPRPMLLLYPTRHCYVYRGEVAAKRPSGPLVYCHLNELT